MVESSMLVSIIIILIRTFIPLTILRWPLLGVLLSILGDISDVMVFEFFGSTFLPGIEYHNVDKIFDTWYLFLAFVVIFRRWRQDKLARNTGIILFLWRFVGFLVFMLAGIRSAFFFAPNIFEFFFLATLIIWKFNPKFKYTWKSLIVTLLIVGIPNIIKEYFMHFAYPDKTWIFFRDHLFWWMYK